METGGGFDLLIDKFNRWDENNPDACEEEREEQAREMTIRFLADGQIEGDEEFEELIEAHVELLLDDSIDLDVPDLNVIPTDPNDLEKIPDPNGTETPNSTSSWLLGGD